MIFRISSRLPTSWVLATYGYVCRLEAGNRKTWARTVVVIAALVYAALCVMRPVGLGA